MKRQIKFRAWDQRKSEMVFEHNTKVELLNIGFNEPDFEHFDIMQFTGLLDVNGYEIYEGDVVKIKNNLGEYEPPYIIKWSDKVFNFIGEGGPGEWLMLEEFEDCEIIGNVHENPELL